MADGWRRWPRRAGAGAAYLVLAVAALLLALAVTPPVRVTVFGQNLDVGAVAPSAAMGWSGSGEADLFGAGPVPTVQRFDGPIRPRLVWQTFTRNDAAGEFVRTTTEGGRTVVRTDTDAAGAALARGWIDFFVRLVVVAGLAGGLVHLASTALAAMLPTPVHRWRPAHPVRGLALAVVATLAATTAAAALSVGSARDRLAGVHSLADLTGTAPLIPAAVPVSPAVESATVAVIGDSTAAGVGNAPIADPGGFDETCGRSSDAYARVLQSALSVAVVNLACSSATISAGLLGPQVEGATTIPAQVGVLASMPSLRVVVVSVGANDIGWSDFLQACYGLPRCDDQVSASLALSRINRFRLDLAQLLVQLTELPSRPDVVLTGYYDPFGDRFDCPALIDPHAPDVPPPGYGFAAPTASGDPEQTMRQKIEPLRSFLAQLDTLLRQSARAFGFAFVQPSFEGHGLCSTQPWVQGLSDRYPFHPNAAGELAIAAAALPQLATLVTR